MHVQVRAVAYSACVFTLIFLIFRPSQAQHQAAPASSAENASTSQGTAQSAPANNAASGKVTIFYTSQLYGYFRAPDVQPAEWTDAEKKKGYEEGCSAAESSESPAAIAFDVLWRDQTNPGRILVGTGNNLAPVLWARQFDPAPEDQYRGANSKVDPAKAFKRTGKELFSWDPTQKKWLTNESVSENPAYKPLLDKLGKGEGTIPTDNVACFLRRAGYAAIVPGKYDFYFGPERLRELARFLADSGKEAVSGPDGRQVDGSDGKPEWKFSPVEMLGANLVIETTWKSDHKPVGDSEDPPWFIPRFPTAKDLGSDSGVDIQFAGLSDGGTVYPWFMGPTVKFVGSAVPDALTQALSRSYLCETVKEKPSDPQSPNAIPESFAPPLCRLVQLVKAEQGRAGASYRLLFPWINNDPQHRPILKPGENYGLCVEAPKTATAADNKGSHTFCVRFSVYTPFFQDLEPYKLVEMKDHPEWDVAIFGVVDPSLGQDVGMLNFAWSNSEKKKYKTETAAKDPGEALKELVGYFEHKYEEEKNEKFGGVKILLAQMTPEEAQKLATRVGGFEAVVSDADSQLSGVGEIRTAEWKKSDPSNPQSHHAFLAVPQPYWVSGNHLEERVDLGKLTIDIGPTETERTFTAVHVLEKDPPDKDLGPVRAPGGFWSAVVDYVNNRCLTGSGTQRLSLSDGSSENEKAKGLQWLTMCAMQQEIGADVVLLQKRDFYLDWQQRPPAKSFESFQQFLDRVIWKGDFLTLRYVPGSTLQNVMKQSKAFDDDDKSLLSLSGETNRGLVSVGIRPDSNSGQYLINEVPLDPTRVYAVATSDFIAAGDTGYPDLAANAIRQFTTPTEFDKKLKNISGVVCQKLKPAPPDVPSAGNPAPTCLDPIKRDDYFDEIVASPTDMRQGDTWSPKLWEWSIFDRPKHVPGSTGNNGTSENPNGVDRYVQQRPLRSTRINQPDTTLFALDNAALNLNMLDHKFSDAGLAQTFPGNPTPQLSARRSHTVGYDIQPKFLYSWHKYQLFETTEMSYNVQDTGNLNARRTVNQKQNLFSSDTGFARDIKDRTFPHLEILGTFHYETQIAHPTTATLAPLPKGDSFAPGVNTARTHYFLPRLGLRYVNRASWIEAGMEDGGELQAVRLVPPAAGGTVFGLSRTNVLASGTYWKWHLVVPFGSKVSWTEDEDGDFFFNQSGDAPTDTRFRSDAKTSVNFQVFPSLSFAPTYEFFYYSNKVQGDWFWQNQASIQMKVRFDFWNRNRPVDQFKYKAASGTSQ